MSQPAADTDNICAGLNEPQREAVTHVEGPLLVLAGVGSGKTRVITRRAVYLSARTGEGVLAITFTNKAGGEMRNRIEALSVLGLVTTGTFHSFCARLLRMYGQCIGLPNNYSIFDQADRRQALKHTIEECNVSAENFTPAKVEYIISRAKNDLVTAEQYESAAFDFSKRNIAKVFLSYERYMASQQAVDFDDLLLKTAQLLEEHEDIRTLLASRYRYVLIDEYQDTNKAQYVIARYLTQDTGNLCATGDPDQSIYSWRGADLDNILRFEADYPDARVIRLEQNYRSTQRILASADALISCNIERKEKALWTQNPQGEPIRVVEHENPIKEADWIADELLQLKNDKQDLSDVAVFYRVNAQTRVLEESLITLGVPYQIARGTEFYNRKVVKDILAYIRVLVNPADDVALLRIINTPARGIGKTTVERLVAFARQTSRTVFEALKQASEAPILKKSLPRLNEFAAILESMQDLLEAPAAEAVRTVLERSGLEENLKGQADVNPELLENANELINAAAEFQKRYPDGTLIDWLTHTSLIADIDTLQGGSGSVTLMTLHAAKGLEFPRVYIMGLEDGLLPHQRSQQHDRDLEEERRLCFVGMTRAMQHLTLTHARWRTTRGSEQRSTRSEFLSQLAANGVEFMGREKSESTSAPRPPGRKPHTFQHWKTGMRVQHPDYGIGQLLSIERCGSQTRAEVSFPSGTKSFILEHANLTSAELEDSWS